MTMTNAEMDQEVMALVNRHNTGLPVVARIIPEEQAKEITERLEAVGPDLEDLRTLRQEKLEEMERKERHRQTARVALPAAAVLMSALMLITATADLIHPGLASLVAAPWIVAGFIPFTPWREA